MKTGIQSTGTQTHEVQNSEHLFINDNATRTHLFNYTSFHSLSS